MARIRRPLRQVNLARTLNLIAFLPLASRAPVYGRLIWSLLRDDRVPPAQKAVLAVAMGYVVLPIDLLPDRLPILGVVDDVAVAVVAIDLFLEGVPATLLDEKLVELGIERAWLERDLAQVRRFVPRQVRQLLRLIPEAIEAIGDIIIGSGADRRLRAWIMKEERPA
ncbi:MAG TPA: YkvA family protein [Candidatus Limnocylindrales bacterium]|jgi:uncharacterized membrane protein YkvA (DUF1232 family)